MFGRIATWYLRQCSHATGRDSDEIFWDEKGVSIQNPHLDGKPVIICNHIRILIGISGNKPSYDELTLYPNPNLSKDPDMKKM